MVQRAASKRRSGNMKQSTLPMAVEIYAPFTSAAEICM
jgi:hypothetical protein